MEKVLTVVRRARQSVRRTVREEHTTITPDFSSELLQMTIRLQKCMLVPKNRSPRSNPHNFGSRDLWWHVETWHCWLKDCHASLNKGLSAPKRVISIIHRLVGGCVSNQGNRQQKQRLYHGMKSSCAASVPRRYRETRKTPLALS